MGSIAKLIAIQVLKIRKKLQPFVGNTRAVVVNAVAEFNCSRMNGGIVVVAIQTIVGIASGQLFDAGRKAGGSISVGIAVGVNIKSIESQSIVGYSTAIIVQAVANLRCARVNGGVVVVAVHAIDHKACWGFGQTSIQSVGKIAESILVLIAEIGVYGEVVVHLSIAIVVEPITNICCSG